MPKSRSSHRAHGVEARPRVSGHRLVAFKIPAGSPLRTALRAEWQAFNRARAYAETHAIQGEEIALAETELKYLGRALSPSERRENELQVKMHSALRRQHVLEKTVPSAWVQEFLGITRQAISLQVKNRKLLAIEEGGRLYFPEWQFDPTAPGKVLRGLREVLPVLELSDYAATRWFEQPQTSFKGKTPLAMLQEGKVNEVLIEARSVGAP